MPEVQKVIEKPRGSTQAYSCRGEFPADKGKYPNSSIWDSWLRGFLVCELAVLGGGKRQDNDFLTASSKTEPSMVTNKCQRWLCSHVLVFVQTFHRQVGEIMFTTFEISRPHPFLPLLSHTPTANFSTTIFPIKIFQGLSFWGALVLGNFHPSKVFSLARGWARQMKALGREASRTGPDARGGEEEKARAGVAQALAPLRRFCLKRCFLVCSLSSLYVYD